MTQHVKIQIRISEKLFLKDPDSTALGRKIIAHSIVLIDEIGFEQFTFKKLAERISSTEASVYRYFENKHKLLIYLVSWYWSWMQYQLTIITLNRSDPKDKLLWAVRLFTHTAEMLPAKPEIELPALYRIVIAESPKAYLTKEVDADNKEGSFLSYKRFCRQVADIVREINPKYPYPTALVSTAVESAHDQKYFSDHLPSLTEVSDGNKEEVRAFLTDLIFRVIESSGPKG
jgi:AcrR family transcriptional regulator